MQAEEASTKIPPQSLDVCVAQTEGSMGFLLQQAIRNRLDSIGLGGDVATILTEVEVDPNDPAFKRPTKPIGPFFTRYRAEALERDLGWTMREDAGRGWRHVVPSPRPLRILNIETIVHMLDSAAVVIAAGGGGIPVVRGRDGQWRGVEAVIDKDFASSLLAVGAARRDVRRPHRRRESGDRLREAGAAHRRPPHRRRGADATSPRASSPPARWARRSKPRSSSSTRGGKQVLITDVEHLRDALAGRDGTLIVA